MKMFTSILSQSRVMQWISCLAFVPDPIRESWVGKTWLPISASKAGRTSGSFPESFLRWGISALLAGALFMPRFSLQLPDGAYLVDFRVEDFVLLIFIGLLPQLKISDAASAQGFSVERYFIVFLIAGAVSVFGGILQRTVDKPIVSFLYLLKWVEFYFVFAIVSQIVKRSSNLNFLIKLFWLAGILLACYGYWELWFFARPAGYPDYYRLFERYSFHGDANHIGGFFVLWFALFAGVFLKTRRQEVRWALAFSLAFALLPFLWTYSRKSYLAMAAAFLSGLFFCASERKKILLWLSVGTLAALVLPTGAAERLRALSAAIMNPDPYASSWAGNLMMWNNAFWNFDKFFIFGSGLGSRHRLFYESQYVMTLTETGIIGMGAYLLLLTAPLRAVISAIRKNADGLVCGYGMAWIGLMVHSLSCVSLTVVKIALPFWLLTAVVLVRCDQIQREGGCHD